MASDVRLLGVDMRCDLRKSRLPVRPDLYLGRNTEICQTKDVRGHMQRHNIRPV